MDLLDVLGARRVGAHALEVGQDARLVVPDLTPHLGLVDELRAQDALDGALGLRLNRRPRLHAREVRLQVGAHRPRGTAAAEREQGERESEPRQPTPRNRRTPRRNTSSWSWCTQ